MGPFLLAWVQRYGGRRLSERRSDTGRPWYGQIRAGLRFTHPFMDRRFKGVLVRGLLEVQPDNASKALDMPRVTWDRQGGQPTYDLDIHTHHP